MDHQQRSNIPLCPIPSPTQGQVAKLPFYFDHHLIELEKEIEKEMNHAILRLKLSQTPFFGKAIHHLRVDLYEKIPKLSMSEERKSYFLHQIANYHDLDDLISLVRDINKKLLTQKPSSGLENSTRIDLLVLAATASGITWRKHSFFLITTA